MSDFILVLGDRQAVGWVLSEQRAAFANQGRGITRLRPDDRLLIHTTRGCFKNPTKHRGRIIAEATVTSLVTELPDPPRFAERTYPYGCTLHIEAAAPLHHGPNLADLAPRIAALDHAHTGWASRLRRTLVALPQPGDYATLRTALATVEQPLAAVLAPYLQWQEPAKSPERATG